MKPAIATKELFNSPTIKAKLNELLGKNAASFATSVLSVVNGNDMLKDAEPMTVFTASCMAATLNLPINNNLGFAYIVPFKNGTTKRVEAQFQLGYKGFIQLAQRTGQFKKINVCAIYDGDDDDSIYNRLTALLPKAPPSQKVIGYIAYFALINGFEAHLSMTMDELQAHAKRYSQSYKKGFGVWADNFDAMAQKTVLKLLLSKQAPLSIDMPLTQAIQADQAVIIDGEYRYSDNEPSDVNTAISMDLSNDNKGFENLIQAVQSGQLDKAQVLSGKAGYRLSDTQYQTLQSA